MSWPISAVFSDDNSPLRCSIDPKCMSQKRSLSQFLGAIRHRVSQSQWNGACFLRWWKEARGIGNPTESSFLISPPHTKFEFYPRASLPHFSFSVKHLGQRYLSTEFSSVSVHTGQSPYMHWHKNYDRHSALWIWFFRFEYGNFDEFWRISKLLERRKNALFLSWNVMEVWNSRENALES